MKTIGTIALYIGVFDAFALLLMGIISAWLYLFGIEAKMFWDRVWPAAGIMLATSAASVLILITSRWIAGILGS